MAETYSHFLGKPLETLALVDQGPSDTIQLLSSSANQISLWSCQKNFYSHETNPKLTPIYQRGYKVVHKQGKIGCVNLTGLQSVSTTPNIFLASDDNGFLHSFKLDAPKPTESVKAHTSGSILSLDIQTHSYQMLTCGEDGNVNIRSLVDFSSIQKINVSAVAVHTARFATDTLIFTAAQNVVKLWDLRVNTQEAVQQLLQPQIDTSATVWDLSVHPDQPHICAAGDSNGSCSVWDIRQAKGQFVSPVLTSHQHNQDIWRLQFSRLSPNILLSASNDGSVGLINLDPKKSRVEQSNIVYYNDFAVGERKVIEHFPTGICDFVVSERVLIAAHDDERISFSALPIGYW